MTRSISIKNKKASFEYQILSTYTAGIVLEGSEIKSIRNSEANISSAFCVFIGNELFIKNLHIAEYKENKNEDPTTRDRKLLLNRKELNKIQTKVQEKGMTVIPLQLFINEKGKAKLEIATAKGKKLYDKRQSIKEKDQKRDIQRIKNK